MHILAPSDMKQDLVLYIEDNIGNLALIEALFERRGDVQLISARNGQEGVLLARTRQPAMILMDINLPDMSGLDALKYLREHPATAHMPVMALSSNAFPLQVEQGIAAGFFRYLTKPLNIAEFTAALGQCLDFAHSQSKAARSA